jgi:hypothetical protein
VLAWTFPDDPDACDPKGIKDLLTPEVLRAVAGKTNAHDSHDERLMVSKLIVVLHRALSSSRDGRAGLTS